MAKKKNETGILAINAKGHPVMLSPRLWEELGREKVAGNRDKNKQSLYQVIKTDADKSDLNKALAEHRDEGEPAAKPAAKH